MSDDNIIQFPGRKPTDSDQDDHVDSEWKYELQNMITISWDDLEEVVFSPDWGLGEDIIQDSQISDFRDSLVDLLVLVQANPELAQFAQKHIDTYTENLRKNLQGNQ